MGFEEKKAGLGELLTQAGELSFDWEEEGTSGGPASEDVSVLCFRVGGDFFGLEASFVREIVGTSTLTALPGAPSHIRGIVVLRRQVVGVLDLGKFLGLESRACEGQALRGQALKSRTVIVEIGKYVAGINVDQVDGLEKWPRDVLESADLSGAIGQKTQRYMSFAHYAGDDLKVLLDLKKLLDDAAVR